MSDTTSTSDLKGPPVPHLAARDAVNRLAYLINSGAISRGDVAALRRLSPDDVASPSFWRVITGVLEPLGVFVNGHGERRWAVILAFLAELNGQHATGVRLGAALAEADVSEMRLLRLLRAHNDTLFDVVRHVAHQLSSRATRFDHAELAEVVLSDGTLGEEFTRRRIARDYYSRIQRREATQ